jgi:hypothetical protein
MTNMASQFDSTNHDVMSYQDFERVWSIGSGKAMLVT